jgi:hypothetical protein
MNALMRGNMTARATYYTSRFQVGSITPNEIRAKEGDNPFSGEPKADAAYLQAQYVPLEMAGEAMAGKVAPDKPNPKSKRYNHIHGKDGKFGSGSGGHGMPEGADPKNYRLGGYKGMDDEAMEAHANAYGESLHDHHDPVGELAKDFPEAADADFVKDAKSQVKELEKDQKSEIKEQEREQPKAVKELEREHKDELKEKEAELKEETKDFEREQAKDRKEFEREQAKDLKEKEREEGNEPEDIDAFKDELKTDHATFVETQKADHADHVKGQEIDRADFVETQKDAMKSLLEDQELDRGILLGDHETQHKDLISSLAMELMQKTADMFDPFADDGDDE